MGLFSKMKNIISLDETEVGYLDEQDSKEELVVEKKKRYSELDTEDFGYSSLPPNASKHLSTSQAAPKKEKSILKMNDRIAAITRQYKIVINRPEAFEDATKIVNSLKAKRPVIVSLEGLDIEIQRKIFDFLSGAVYALDYRIDKLSTLIYMFSPDNVEISSDTEKNEIDFSSDDTGSTWQM